MTGVQTCALPILLETKQKELNDSEIIYATESQKIKNFELEILKLGAKRDKLKENIEQNKLEKDKSNKTQEEQTDQMLLLENETKTLNTEIEEFTRLNKDNQKYIDDLKFDINNLEISVSSFDESEISINEFVEKLNEDINSNNLSIQNKIELREEILENNKILSEKNKELNEQITKMKEDVDGSQEKAKALKDERILKNNKLSKLEQDLLEKQNIVEDIKNQISKLEVKSSKINLELEQIINKMWEEYELTPNSIKSDSKIVNPQEVQKNVNNLRSQIKELGSVNIDSIKEYQETKERYDFMCEQRLDLENSISKIKKLITEIVDTMKNQFNEKFKLINKNFKETFKELFGGGKAEIKLEDENNVLECGIEIVVQPPGKKLQNMTLLSRWRKSIYSYCITFFNVEDKSISILCA